MDHKIPKAGSGRRDCETGERNHPAGMRGDGSGNPEGARIKGSRAFVRWVSAESSYQQVGAAIEREKFVENVAGIHGAETEVLGAAIMGEGIFCGEQRKCDGRSDSGIYRTAGQRAGGRQFQIER